MNPFIPVIAKTSNINKSYTTSHLKVAYQVGNYANLCEHRPIIGDYIAIFTFEKAFVCIAKVTSDKANIVSYEVVETKEDIEKNFEFLTSSGLVKA